MADPLAASYYAATAKPLDPLPALDEALDADVCVIGGGFTGLAAALAAAEAGFDTVLIEAERIGFGASGRNGGQLIPGLNVEAEGLVEQLGREHALALYQTAASARERVLDRIAKHGIECDLRSGHLHVAAKKRDMAGFARECDYAARTFGYDALELVEADALPALLGAHGYHGGIFNPEGGHFHPLKYAHGLAKAGMAAGVRIFEQSRVTGIAQSGGVRATTASGSVSARYAVLACDAEMNGVAPQIGRYAMPVANYMVATAALGEERARALIPSGAAVSDSRFVINYFRLSADHRLIYAGGERYTTRPPRDIAAFVRPWMLARFPQLADVSIDHAWGGMVGITLNRLPRFGREGNMFYAHGYSGQGTLLSTLAGELIAEAMTGTAERFDLFARIPHRPFPGGDRLRAPLYVAAMLWYAMRDRL